MTACVVFFGWYISESLSTRASGTFTVPSVIPAFSRVGSVPVSAVSNDVLPLWGKPDECDFHWVLFCSWQRVGLAIRHAAKERRLRREIMVYFCSWMARPQPEASAAPAIQ